MASPVSSSLISNLRKIKERPVAAEEERCNFCGNSIPEDHRHLINLSEMRFKCACEVCAIIQAVHGDYKIIPQHVELLQNFNMPEDLWAQFMIPVNMAFFVFNSNRNGIIAYYPAAAGATESKLKMEPWKKLLELNPVLSKMAPDLEALLVNRLETPGRYYIVPIDSCYKLIGIIKSNWRGISGGVEVNHAISKFFTELKNKIK